MNTELLEQIGLTKNQASIYTTLLEHGPSSASIISRRTGIERALAYVNLGALVNLGLISRNNSKKVTEFRPNHPKILERLVLEKQAKCEVAQSSFDSVFFQLQQAFEIQSGQPGIRFFLGVDGIKKLYAEMNRAQPKEVHLIRSANVKKSDEMSAVIKDQVREQVKRKIKVYVISPSFDALKYLIPKDKDRNTERRIIAAEVFETPSQILIYDNVVAITTYREPIITTVIKHQDIVITMLALFTYIWKQSRAETGIFLKKYTEST